MKKSYISLFAAVCVLFSAYSYAAHLSAHPLRKFGYLYVLNNEKRKPIIETVFKNGLDIRRGNTNRDLGGFLSGVTIAQGVTSIVAVTEDKEQLLKYAQYNYTPPDGTHPDGTHPVIVVFRIRMGVHFYNLKTTYNYSSHKFVGVLNGKIRGFLSDSHVWVTDRRIPRTDIDTAQRYRWDDHIKKYVYLEGDEINPSYYPKGPEYDITLGFDNFSFEDDEFYTEGDTSHGVTGINAFCPPGYNPGAPLGTCQNPKKIHFPFGPYNMRCEQADLPDLHCIFSTKSGTDVVTFRGPSSSRSSARDGTRSSARDGTRSSARDGRFCFAEDIYFRKLAQKYVFMHDIDFLYESDGTYASGLTLQKNGRGLPVNKKGISIRGGFIGGPCSLPGQFVLAGEDGFFAPD